MQEGQQAAWESTSKGGLWGPLKALPQCCFLGGRGPEFTMVVAR